MGGEYFPIVWLCFKIFFHELLYGMISGFRFQTSQGYCKMYLIMEN